MRKISTDKGWSVLENEGVNFHRRYAAQLDKRTLQIVFSDTHLDSRQILASHVLYFSFPNMRVCQ